MTDFSVSALARKWTDGCPHIAPEWEPAPHQPIEMCCLKAAIREALEEAETAHIAFWLRVYSSWKARDFNTLKETLDNEGSYVATIQALRKREG